MNEMVYIGVGSNLCDPIFQVTKAIATLSSLSSGCLQQVSSLYQSAPLGPQDQPDFINAVVGITTALKPMQLLKQLQTIEQAQGRSQAAVRWGARVIDLDIVLYGQRQINNKQLTIPHVELPYRGFVLYPLAEIAPNLVLPTGQLIEDLLQNCPRGILRRITDVNMGEKV